jgi:hypothetical protein
MKNLDCHTKRGRKFIAAQHDTTKILKRIFPSLIFVHSVNATQAEDCYIYCNKILSGVAEIKCREFINRRTQLPYKLDTIRKQYDNEYLITKTKVDNLRMISEQKKNTFVYFFEFASREKDCSLQDYQRERRPRNADSITHHTHDV